MKVIKYIAIISAFGLMPFSVSAMSLTFDLAGAGPGFTLSDSLDFIANEDSSYTINVIGQTVLDGDLTAPPYVSQNDDGIGVCLTLTACTLQQITDSNDLDSVNPEEILRIANTSGSSFDLTGFMFDDITGADSFILMADGINYGVITATSNPFSLVSAVEVSQWFSLHAISGSGSSTSIQLSQIYAQTTALPEPGTLGMLLFGLGAVGFIRRRKLS
jgi:hypothetical protein